MPLPRVNHIGPLRREHLIPLRGKEVEEPAAKSFDDQCLVTDTAAGAVSLLAGGDLSLIEQTFAVLRGAGIEPDSDEGLPVLIEALFQFLEALDQDPADPQVYVHIRRFDAGIADFAANFLLMSNSMDEFGDLAELSDAILLLVTALKEASGQRAAALDFLRRGRMTRSSRTFTQAAVQLDCLLQENTDAVVQNMLARLLEDLDCPELWPALPALINRFPDLIEELAHLADVDMFFGYHWGVLHALCTGASGDVAHGLELIERISAAHGHSPLVQGAVFHLKSLLDPLNPTYDLSDRFCTTPFEELDVLDGKSHLCCANYVPTSVGDLAEQSWEEVWNSESAQSVRAGILDGSFRHCCKTACPRISGNTLPKKDEVAEKSAAWRAVIKGYHTKVPSGPNVVNLAYDRTCNLSCPSCRTHKYAADSTTRARFDRLQEETILPLLRHTKYVFITGSGDPFASKNFRHLLERLGPDDYPDLRFRIMTNGMLFTRREWARFPALHCRVADLRISLDAATGPTHELLRRGARWPVMEDNLAFASELRAQGLIDQFNIAFTVQTDNYHEMGAAVDLAHKLGVDQIGFSRLTNWGTFTPEQYLQKAVFIPSHPEYPEFLDAMRDARLVDPIVSVGNLSGFLAGDSSMT